MTQAYSSSGTSKLKVLIVFNSIQILKEIATQVGVMGNRKAAIKNSEKSASRFDIRDKQKGRNSVNCNGMRGAREVPTLRYRSKGVQELGLEVFNGGMGVLLSYLREV